jgi:hypothetical protein
MMRYAAAVVFLLCAIGATAGETDSLKAKSLRYAFTINSAMLFCANCNIEGSLVAMPTTIHGIRYRKLRAGAGVGYTSFGIIRSMPYFGSVSWDLFGRKRKSGLFVEFNYGGAHAWLSPSQNDRYLDEVKAWGFFQASAGYAFHYQKLRVALQAGFQSLKTRRTYVYGETYTYSWPTGDVIMPPHQSITDYDTRRFFLNLSVGI